MRFCPTCVGSPAACHWIIISLAAFENRLKTCSICFHRDYYYYGLRLLFVARYLTRPVAVIWWLVNITCPV